MIEWIRFWISAALLAAGLVFFSGAALGNCRFDYIMNRVHAGGLGDTMGLFCVIAALVVSAEGGWEACKLPLPLIFLWLCSPVSSHFLAQMEYYTNENLYEHMERL